MAAMLGSSHSEVDYEVDKAANFAEDAFTCPLPPEACRSL